MGRAALMAGAMLAAEGHVRELLAQPAAQRPVDLSRATLEELMDLEITSAARKPQRAEDVAAALFVITREDIRRSGASSLPEVLRLVPGIQVARINANKWAVSIRGFNALNANKLLVLMDGRSVYNRVFSGVLWDAQDIALGDIERIEVIRGPGGAVWGANAVNGIVNIITRSSADTRGAAVDLSAGTFERTQVGVRYGATLARVTYRVYSQWSSHGGGLGLDGEEAPDDWNSLLTGFRADWQRDRDEVTAQGRYVNATSRPNWLELRGPTPGLPLPSPEPSDLGELIWQAGWTHTSAAGATFAVHGFHANTRRDDSLALSDERTSDIDMQYQRGLLSRHDVIVGGGVRRARFTSRGDTFTLTIPSDRSTISNLFVQDELTLSPNLALIVGSKLEHQTDVGWSLLPTARAMWKLSPRQRLWGAVSRARRTPARAERAIRLNLAVEPSDFLPIVVGFVGNPAFESESLVQAEGGYRLGVGSTAEIELTAFRARYSGLMTVEPQAPVFEAAPGPPHLFVAMQAANLLDADSTGLELNVSWLPHPAWRFDAAYSALHIDAHPDPSSRDLAAGTFDANAPTHQWQFRTSASVTPRLHVDGALYYTGGLRVLAIPSYLRADARAELKLTDAAAVIVTGQNLLTPAHDEFAGSATATSRTPRSARVQLRWQF
jgi:iron complex outermembrane receptor protein